MDFLLFTLETKKKNIFSKKPKTQATHRLCLFHRFHRRFLLLLGGRRAAREERGRTAEELRQTRGLLRAVEASSRPWGGRRLGREGWLLLVFDLVFRVFSVFWCFFFSVLC